MTATLFVGSNNGDALGGFHKALLIEIEHRAGIGSKGVYAQIIHNILSKALGHGILAVIHEHQPGLLFKALEPVHQTVPVGMAALAG